MTKIPINIWDDYADDESGIKQETFINVDDNDVPLDDQLKYLGLFMNIISHHKIFLGSNYKAYIKLYKSREVYPNIPPSMHNEQWRIEIENMTHERREYLVEKLNKLDTPFDVYSES